MTPDWATLSEISVERNSDQVNNSSEIPGVLLVCSVLLCSRCDSQEAQLIDIDMLYVQGAGTVDVKVYTPLLKCAGFCEKWNQEKSWQTYVI